MDPKFLAVDFDGARWKIYAADLSPDEEPILGDVLADFELEADALTYVNAREDGVHVIVLGGALAESKRREEHAELVEQLRILGASMVERGAAIEIPSPDGDPSKAEIAAVLPGAEERAENLDWLASKSPAHAEAVARYRADFPDGPIA